MHKFIKTTMKLAIFSMLLLAIAACSNNAEGESKEKEPIVFADAGWDSLKFQNNIAGFIVEEGYGYPTDSMSGSSAAVLSGLREGNVDIHMEIWKQNLIDTYKKGIESGDYVKLSVNFDDDYQGFYVPTYVIEGDPKRGIEPMAPDLEYVSDLPKYWELFKDPQDPSKGRLIGSISGWTVDEMLHKAYKKYNLDENFTYFRPGSEAGINISLSEAYKEGEAWVGYNYEPNWVMGKYDMTALKEKDPEGPLNAIATQDIEILAHKSLPERAPKVADFLSNYHTSSAIANDALAYIQENEATAEEAAIKFLKENEDVWTEWVPEDVAEKVKRAIKEK